MEQACRWKVEEVELDEEGASNRKSGSLSRFHSIVNEILAFTEEEGPTF